MISRDKKTLSSKIHTQMVMIFSKQIAIDRSVVVVCVCVCVGGGGVFTRYWCNSSSSSVKERMSVVFVTSSAQFKQNR